MALSPGTSLGSSVSGLRRTTRDGRRVVAYACFVFCSFAATLFGLMIFLPPDERVGASMMFAFTLFLPMLGAALVGAVLALTLRTPRSLQLLAALTVGAVAVPFIRLSLPIPWTAELSNLVDSVSTLTYGVITFLISSRLWFHEVFRAPWEESERQPTSSLTQTYDS